MQLDKITQQISTSTINMNINIMHKNCSTEWYKISPICQAEFSMDIWAAKPLDYEIFCLTGG